MRRSVNPHCRTSTLNESPSEKEGKSLRFLLNAAVSCPSMKVPPKRKGNAAVFLLPGAQFLPSMKVPPKRKGNSVAGAMEYPVWVSPQ